MPDVDGSPSLIRRIADIERGWRRLSTAVNRNTAQAPIWEYDEFTANGTATVFTLTFPAYGINHASINGMTQRQGTDYTVDFTNGILTFSSAPASGDIVMVSYVTNGALRAPLTTAVDTFNRADSASGLGTASGGWPWHYWSDSLTPGNQTSVWGISSNRAYLTAVIAPGGTLAEGIAYPTITSPNGTLDLDLPVVATGAALAAFRFDTTQTNPNNRTGWLIFPGFVYWLGAGAGGTIIGSAFTSGFASGDHLTLTMNGNSLSVARNGSTVWSTSDSRNASIATVGMASTDTTSRYDNFTWTST